MTSELPILFLKKNEDRRIRQGHLWIYSNEVDTKRSSLAGLNAGDQVVLKDHEGKDIGIAYVNPQNLLMGRLISREVEHPLGKSLLVHRLNMALSLREKLYSAPYYRLVHGEGDWLPGLVVDRYGDYLSVQITTHGMERHKQDVIDALVKVIKPAGILLRNDSSARTAEGLDSYVEVAYGEVPDEVVIDEEGTKFAIPVREGQKTGWFFDQRENRLALRRYARGARVLDVFSYIGSWGMHAAYAGAESVTCVDVSGQALEMVGRNVELNEFNQVDAMLGDAFDVLKALRQDNQRYDLIIIDPPAFIKRRKDIKEGELAYRRLNQAAMQLLQKDGILVSCSCSFHMSRENLQNQILAASRHVDRHVQILEQGYQGPDHPMNLAMPETSYLKTIFCRVTR